MNPQKLKKLSYKQIALTSIVAALILLIFFYALNLFSKKQRQNLHQSVSDNKAISIGKVVDESFAKGHSIKYTFSYKGKSYESWMGDDDIQFKVSKCYLVWFDSTNPQSCILKHAIVNDCP